MALGNALSDPYNMLNYGDYAYQTGLIDKHGWRRMKIFEYLAKEHINDAYGKIVRILPLNHSGYRKFNAWNFILVLGCSTIHIYRIQQLFKRV